MAINEVNQNQDDNKGQQQSEPLLNINLPAPANGDPRTPLTIGQHNAAAQHNFKKVADILMALINNQRMMGSIIENQEKEIKALKESNEAIAKAIKGELSKENEDEPKQPKRT